MSTAIDHHSRCPACDAELLYLAGDPSVPYEDIQPPDGGQRTLVEHTEQRCAFHQFLTPAPGRHVLPGNADWATKHVVNQPRGPALQRWERTDEPS